MPTRSHRILILGSGRQGLAASTFFARGDFSEQITFADRREDRALAAAHYLNTHHFPNEAEPSINITSRQVDARSKDALISLFEEHDAVFSAMSYELNVSVFEAALEAGIPAVDLGGKTSIVFEQMRLHERAAEKKITLVPDCGLAPGLANTLAAIICDEDKSVDTIYAYCGGLPQNPEGPLNYKIVFSVRGLTNEYLGEAAVIENARVTMKPTFTGLEKLSFEKIGDLEAFRTSGGSSTAPWTLKGRLKTYEYKTLRYPGHYEKIKTLIELGFLSDEKNERGISPREITEETLEKICAFPETRDLVVLRVVGSSSDRPQESWGYELIDYHDQKMQLSAMERCTAFPAALVLKWALEERVPAGVAPLEKIIRTHDYIEELRKSGLNIRSIFSQT